MRIKTILCLCLASILLALCGCAASPVGNYDVQSAEETRNSKQVYLTLWSWQIPTKEDAQTYAQKALDCGFTAIDFSVQWSAFEPLRGHFNWSYLDEVVKVFTDAGLKVSLQPLLWTKDLSWADELELQKTENGTVFSVEGRGSFLSFTHDKTLSVVKNTLQHFALHAASYGEHLTRWGVRLSCFGEMDYSVNEGLDYSQSALTSFYDYLKETYGTWGKLAEVRKLPIVSRDDLEALSPKDVVRACRGDWRRFRQENLFRILDMMVDIYRSADKKVPILFSLGTYGNGMNTAYSGVVDLRSAVEGHDVDIIGLSFCDGADGGMMLSLLSSLTTKKIAVEVDGAWALEEGRDVVSQVKTCGAYGVFSLSTANFSAEQLDAHKEVLSTYKSLLLAPSQTLGDRDPSQGILILSNALAESNPPRAFDVLYGEAWKKLSENGARPVRFVTEDQIADREVSLRGVTTLYLGNIKGSVPVREDFAKAFSSTETVLKGSVSFVLTDGRPLSEEWAESISPRIQAE